jgi:hypothetical protein
MAGVYRAVHKLGMPVAVKILPPSKASASLVVDHRTAITPFATTTSAPRGHCGHWSCATTCL